MAGAAGAAGAAAAAAATGAVVAAAAFLFTPPWPLQAPRMVVPSNAVPSLQTAFTVGALPAAGAVAAAGACAKAAPANKVLKASRREDIFM